MDSLIYQRIEIMILLAVVFPGLSFLLRGKLLSAIVAFVLQITVLGWLPVSIWAVASLLDARSERRFQA